MLGREDDLFIKGFKSKEEAKEYHALTGLAIFWFNELKKVFKENPNSEPFIYEEEGEFYLRTWLDQEIVDKLYNGEADVVIPAQKLREMFLNNEYDKVDIIE